MASTTSGSAPVPQKAIDFLGRKVNVETEKWDDLKWGEHAHALTVAHSANAGILDEIHRLLNDAVEKGISFQDFRNGMLDTMKKSGWYGGAGHTKKDKRYINWRIGVIYDTNMKTTYAQAEYRDQLQGADLRPIWVYQSQLTGDNRRQEHIDLHGKAFRYDDNFWDTYYPPNGWGCECYVNTESEHSAEKAGITVEDSKNLTLPEIDPTWKYNVGREALAPNFSRYKNLDREALSAVKEKYRAGMEGAKIPRGELKKLKDAMITGDYRSDKKRPVNFHISTLEKKRQEALGIDDCKVMATGERIYHSFRKKGDKTLPDKNFDGVYKNLQSPEMIYEEIHSRHGEEGRVFHFITETRGGKIINAVLQKRNGMALRVITIDLGEMKDIKAAGDLKEITY